MNEKGGYAAGMSEHDDIRSQLAPLDPRGVCDLAERIIQETTAERSDAARVLVTLGEAWERGRQSNALASLELGLRWLHDREGGAGLVVRLHDGNDASRCDRTMSKRDDCPSCVPGGMCDFHAVAAGLRLPPRRPATCEHHEVRCNEWRCTECGAYVQELRSVPLMNRKLVIETLSEETVYMRSWTHPITLSEVWVDNGAELRRVEVGCAALWSARSWSPLNTIPAFELLSVTVRGGGVLVVAFAAPAACRCMVCTESQPSER